MFFCLFQLNVEPHQCLHVCVAGIFNYTWIASFLQCGRPSLKLLCREILNVKVQQGEHSSVSHQCISRFLLSNDVMATKQSWCRSLIPRSKMHRPPWGSTLWWKNSGRQRLKPERRAKNQRRRMRDNPGFPRRRRTRGKNQPGSGRTEVLGFVHGKHFNG